MFEIQEPNAFDVPSLDEKPYEQAFEEIALLGFPLCSPFDLIESRMASDYTAKNMVKYEGKTMQIVGYYVTKKDVTTPTNEHMNFATWIDRQGEMFDSVHFPISLNKSPFQGKGCYLLRGKIVVDFGFPSLEVHQMQKIGFCQQGNAIDGSLVSSNGGKQHRNL